jgi:hypothetical protein
MNFHHNCLIVKVVWAGIEPATQGFSVIYQALKYELVWFGLVLSPDNQC